MHTWALDGTATRVVSKTPGSEDSGVSAATAREGADDVTIHKKVLKTGRELWTLGGPG